MLNPIAMANVIAAKISHIAAPFRPRTKASHFTDASNDQHEQLNKSDADQEHGERHGIVFKPMPTVGLLKLFLKDRRGHYPDFDPGQKWLVPAPAQKMRRLAPTNTVGFRWGFSFGLGRRQPLA
jgi:hypothetical protein